MDRILIVDDNPKNIQVLGSILSDNNFEIEFAQNGQEALDIVATEDFDLILMDIMMPEMDGFEACERIKQMHTKSEIPIIFITARNDNESVTNAFKKGGIDYINKPFNVAELLSRVETHIALKKSKDDLQNINKILEVKVKKRTAELKISNEQLSKAYKELEVIDETKNEFLNLISHEIRTPLNGILGFSNLLRQTIKDDTVEELFEYLDLSCKRLEDFSFRALDITKLRSKGIKTLAIQPINLTEIIHEVVQSFQKQIEKKNLSVDVKIDPTFIFADINYLQKCMDIVISNAVHHSQDMGKVTIHGEQLTDFSLISIKNEGSEFPQKIIEEEITAFTSDHTELNPGLDLYLCKLIIEAHGGRILFVNDAGAKVEIQFPKK